MTQDANNLITLIYLKNKLQKWKNLFLVALIIIALLLARLLFGGANSDSIGENFIANIKIDGVITDDDFRSESLDKVAKQSNIKAVLIRINSPGGGIVSSEILYDKIRNIAKNKPTVILLESVAASGGYMAAIGGDYIITHNGTITGSIGVLMQSAEVTELAHKFGVKFKAYKSSPIKGSPSPFEESNPQVDQIINASIKDSYEFFSELVRERRQKQLAGKDFGTITDGRIFTGRQALKAGLVDQIGNQSDALEYLQKIKKIDIKTLPLKEVVIKESKNKFFDTFSNLIPFYKDRSLLGDNQMMAITN